MSSTPPNSPSPLSIALEVELPVTPKRRHRLIFPVESPRTTDDDDTPRPKHLSRAELLDFEDPNTPTPARRSTHRPKYEAHEEGTQSPSESSSTSTSEQGESSDSARSNVPGRRKDWVLPLPFDPPSAADIHSLHDLLRVTLPENPPPYRDGALTGMKTVTEHEFAISAEAPLKKVVYVPDLVTQLRDQAEKQLSNLKIDMDTLNPDLLSVCQMHPYLTARNLPQKIHSEKDTEDWCNAVLFRPALAALRCVIAKKIIHNFEFKYPYISSAPGRKVIPDGILVRKNTLFHQESDSDFWYIKDGKVILTIEVKTQPAWEKMRFEKLQALPIHFEKGTAMRFVWPTREDKPDEQTRLLVQAWTHIVKSVHGIEILSTLHLTTFLVRGRNEDNSDTLYISPSYDRESCPIYAVYCWFALAMGVINFESLNLPSPITTRWPDGAMDEYQESCGILPATQYDAYELSATPNVNTRGRAATGKTTRSRRPAAFEAL